MAQKALILMGHGSRSKQAIEEFDFVVEATQQKTKEFKVFGAHMEINDPTLERVVSEVDALGIQSVVVIPYFLFNGNHIKFDIPKQVEALQQQYPKIKITLGSPIAKEPLMADLMLKKAMYVTNL